MTKKSQHPLLYYIRLNPGFFFWGMFFLIITNILDGYWPMILKTGIDQITNKEAVAILQTTCLQLFGILVALAGTRFLWRILFGRYHTYAAEELRNRLFRHYLRMGPSFFQKNPLGELMSLITNDIQVFRNGIGSGVLILVDGIVIMIVVLPLMLAMNPSWTWKTLIFLPLVPILIWQIHKMIFERYFIQQDKLAALSGVSQEIVSGIRVIKSFAQENNQLANYNTYSKTLEEHSNRVARVDSLFVPIMQFGVITGTVILLFISGQDVIAGVATVGTFVAFQRYILKMVWPMTALGLGISQFQKGMASYARIKNVLDQTSDIPDHGTRELKNFESLEVRNLTFAFGDSQKPTLKDVSFTLRRGETLGIVGTVGSGKSTLLNLLNRLYPAPENSILINGYDIAEYTQNSLREQFVFIPQEPFLFSVSVDENIRYGMTSEMQEPAEHWAELVDIRGEIESLPAGFASQLGERGVNLSGGQKQRLTIARGLIKRSSVIFLDDSLSAVDTKTEHAIQRDVFAKSTEQTKVIVSHRVSSVQNSDQILVLNNGSVEAIGTHHELLESSPTYRRMVDIQKHQGEEKGDETRDEVPS